MTYYASQDPLYHETYFSDEILKTQDYVKQCLFAVKNAETHGDWETGVEWRGRQMTYTGYK